jgi:hypothetical protein
MLDFREIDHPTKFLYQHEQTGEFFQLVGFDGDLPILQPVNLIVRVSTPLLEASQQVLRLPQRAQSRPHTKPIDGYYSGIAEESTIEGEVISEEMVPYTPAVVEAIKRLPIEGKIFLPLVMIILAFFGLAVPIIPKVVTSIQQASVPTPVVSSGKATDRLQRISQLDQGQYDAGQYTAYSPSACSAASLTEAFNAYGASYKINIILGAEISEGVISPSAGLTDLSGITKTANRFGFDTQAISGLDQAISTANNGTPVIVDILPGSAWPGGHFLVLKGGSDSEVQIIDSWSTNFQSVSKGRFIGWNLGSMWTILPSRYSLLQGRPTLSSDQVNAVLTASHSPMAGQGQLFVDMSNTYHIDDAYVLATFWHESSYGTTGEAVQSKSAGNLRCASPDWTGGWCSGGYEWFNSWDLGLKDLYILLSGSHYSGAGHNTPAAIIPMYAPSSDNNNEAGYIQALQNGIDKLRTGKTTF